MSAAPSRTGALAATVAAAGALVLLLMTGARGAFATSALSESESSSAPPQSRSGCNAAVRRHSDATGSCDDVDFVRNNNGNTPLYVEKWPIRGPLCAAEPVQRVNVEQLTSRHAHRSSDGIARGCLSTLETIALQHNISRIVVRSILWPGMRLSAYSFVLLLCKSRERFDEAGRRLREVPCLQT